MDTLILIKFFVLDNLKKSMKSSISIWFKILISVIKHLMFVLAWHPFYYYHNNINGWHFEHHMLMIGLVTIGTGFVEVFFDGLRDLAKIIETQELDKYLVMPQDPVILIALSKSSITSWSDILAGIVLIYLSGLFSPIILIFIITSILFFFSLYLYLGSLRFFIENGTSFLNEIYSKTLLIASQPNVSYKGILKLLTFSILPVSLVSYFPIEYIYKQKIIFLILPLLGNIAFYIMAQYIFSRGLKRYSSFSQI